MTVQMLSSSPSMGRVLARAAISPLLKRDRAPQLPELTMGVDGVRTDGQKLAAYNDVCGFSSGPTVPATWVHILAFPLAGALMTDERFPFPMIGLVHIRNRIVQHRAIGLGDALDIRARLGNLRKHDKGVLFSVLSEASLRGDKVWEEESVYLRRGKFPSLDAPQAEASDSDVPVEQPEATDEWKLPEDLGRRYGQASGDMNPIHLHALSARAFGFKRAIAHGMWTQARALAALSNGEQGALTLDTHFKVPAFLPGKATFRTKSEGKLTRFEVRDARGEKPHARGTLGPAA